ncbi:MAG: Rpp14/Pop5 family protein [Candidatus Ranarchaeia archaeon]
MKKNQNGDKNKIIRRKMSPARRPKERYLLLYIIENKQKREEPNSSTEINALTKSELQFGLNRIFLRVFGERNASLTHLKIIQHNYSNSESKHTMILRTTLKMLEETKEMLSLTTYINDRKGNTHYLIPKIERISGSLKVLRTKGKLEKPEKRN